MTDISIFAEPIFSIKNFIVSNALINAWIVVLGFIVLAIVVRLGFSKKSSKLQNFMEWFLEGALSFGDSITGDREKTLKFAPFVLPIFCFILLSNWLGIMPGVGSIGFLAEHSGKTTFIPYLRSAMSDLNMTLALAIVAVLSTHIAGVLLTSPWKHLNRFVGLNLFLEIPKKIKQRDFSILIVNPIKFFVGIIEIAGEFAKTASLSLRLFGNVFAGEVLLGAMASMFAFFLPVPFLLLEVLVGFIQAFIFSVLILVFLNIMSESHEEHEEAHA
ncbi:MAG: FoF1 ATP synthase subunit a [bacterium]|nr:FoF1 ATP synthase subunit a [bacterium]